ncbi:hypothetical protein [Streptomyces harbinensis]|uniref:hypothetical protein n=1 Tax=Streptomyces harbinensis TaxID=1176198 RepID=UPI0036A57995
MDRLPDTTTPLTPTTITPGPLDPAPAGEPMVWVPGPGNGFVAVPRSLLPADYFTPPAPAPPARGGIAASIDPRAQVLAAGGLGIGAAGWGLGQILSAMAGLGTAGLAALALAAVVARMPRPGTTTADNTSPGASTEIHVHRGARVKARNLNIR